MKEQIQERPSAWRLLVISSMLIVCAQVSLAAAGELSLSSLSDAIGLQGPASNGDGALLVRFVDADTPPVSCPDLVGPRTQRARRAAISERIVGGADVERQYDDVVPGLTLVTLPEGTSTVEAVMKFTACADVLYAEPNYRYQLSRTPNDPNFALQWALDNTGQEGGLPDADVDAPEAWDITTGSKDLIVAVLDTGIDPEHPDLKANLWSNRKEASGKADTDDDGNGYVDDVYGYDFVTNTKDPVDDVYHGTFVAGVIGAVGNNGAGISGVSWNISLMICRVADDEGVNLDAAVAAVQYATAAGAKIINASWSGREYSKSLRDAIEAAGQKGILFVAAAGNDSTNNDDTPAYPASYDLYNVISVMATNNQDQMASTTNHGVRTVDIAEPGEGVLSTTPTTATDIMDAIGLTPSYGVLSGTSVAAPHVSGACALLWSKSPALKYQQIKQILLQTTDKVVPGLCRSHGRVNLAGALGEAPAGGLGRILNTRDDPNDAASLYMSLQEAIDDANDGDTLILEGGVGADKLFLEQIDFKGKAITVRSGNIANPSDPTLYPETTIICGLSRDGSVVTFANGEGRDTVLMGVTVAWGIAEYGGGIRCEDASPTIRDCVIRNNHARVFGGGIDCLGGSPAILNCVVRDNVAYGSMAFGGGMNFEDASPEITDSTIRNNSSMGAGGGIAFSNSSGAILNSFLLNNSAAGGSGQIDLDASSPTITNCTILVEDSTPSRDGGVCAFDSSNPTITNSILWGNGDDLFGCSATYSCIEDADGGEGVIHTLPAFTQGSVGVCFLSQTAAGQVVDSPCVNAGDPNTNPDVVAKLAAMTTRTDGVADANVVDLGAHYAAFEATYYPLTVTIIDPNGNPVDPNNAGGTVDPNAGSFRLFEIVQVTAQPKDGYRIKRWVGTGDDTQKNATLTFTVSGPITLGIEFEEVPQYRLITRVEGRPRVEGSDQSCTISPDHSRGEYYRDGEVVTLTATPVGAYIVGVWTGTDDDASWARTNTVTMTSDKEVSVSFMLPRTLEVPGQYVDIGSALEAARTHGDTVIVERGTYTVSSEYDFNGKAITLSSANPDDPACVAATILDCGNLTRAFVFRSGEGNDSVIDGFTIQNGSAVANPTTSPGGGAGADGADAFGGAIACFNGSSPTLSNLNLVNCRAHGQTGEDASNPPDAQADPIVPEDAPAALDQLDDPEARDPNSTDPNAPEDPNMGMPGANGANGLDGAPGADGAAGANASNGGRGGLGYGGALYFDANSAPIILSCTISNCYAQGGDGGYGGQGQDGAAGGDGQNGQDGQQGQNGGEGYEDGDQGIGGNGGNGGVGGAGGIGGNGGNGGNGGAGGEALGGAIYFGPNCRPTIQYTTIQSTSTQQGIGAAGGAAGNGGAGGTAGVGGVGGDAGDGSTPGQPGQDGAAGVSGAGGNGGIGGNMGMNGGRSHGGAIFFGDDCQAEISDTVISDCNALGEVATDVYAGGNGGVGAAGGTDAAGGVGGAGGNGSPAGNGGENAAGGSAAGGATISQSPFANAGGGIYYSVGCSVKLTNCTFSGNASFQDGGGAEYYSDNCTTVVTRCAFSGNTAGTDRNDDVYGNGGGQAFTTGCSATITGSSYLNNVTEGDGGALYCWYDCDLDIRDTTFTTNDANTPWTSAGGAIYGGGVFQSSIQGYYNGGAIRVQDCQFKGNDAVFGGGMYWYGYDADVSVTDSAFRDNVAYHGGALYWSDGAPTINNCIIRGNTALGGPAAHYVAAPAVDANDPTTWPPVDEWPTPGDVNSILDPDYTPNPILVPSDANCGSGGGLYCLSSEALIENSYISENLARGIGGGVYFADGMPTLKNCLVNGNTAYIGGGGVGSHWSAAPTITNCTIVANEASDANDSTRGYGGGLFCSYESQTILLNSILWDNQGRFGSQIAIGSKDDPTYLQRPAGLTVRFSDIQGGETGVAVEAGRTLNWPAGNLDSDPLFVAPYFLSQTAAGQAQDSPAVNAGSVLASVLGLDTYTTRSDAVTDAGQVDMGYHYVGEGQYQLTVTVLGGHGTAQPLGGRYHELQTVTLLAIPDPNYRVKEWTGTDDDPSWNDNTNAVTFSGSDVYVTVEFEPDVINNLLVPHDFATIEDAVEAAGPGGTNIVVGKGVHYVSSSNGIDFQGKTIVLMSVDPNDPDIVANTIIDVARTKFNPGRAFYFHSGEDANSVIAGITIRNGFVRGPLAADGTYGTPNPVPYDVVYAGDLWDPPRCRAERGDDADGDSYGGGILCENGSSPTFKNCVITNCVSTGGHGGNGAEGVSTDQGTPDQWGYYPPGEDSLQTTNDGEYGGHGGIGAGVGHGGGMACLGGSSPILIGCTFEGNGAYGGIAGAGGNGGNGAGLESWGGSGGEARGDGRGGAIYCDTQSVPVIRNCRFISNIARSGVAGAAGQPGSGNALPAGWTPAGPGQLGITVLYEQIGGGAIYYGDQTRADINDSVFTDNQSFEGFAATDEYQVASEIHIDYKGGAIYSQTGNTLDLDGCEFTDNLGNAVYVVGRCALDVNDCRFVGNERQDRSLTDYEGYSGNTNSYVLVNNQRTTTVRVFDGGAIYLGPNCSRVSVTNSAFHGNLADECGGAIRTLSSATITDCVFGGNEALEVGGAICGYYENGYPTEVAILTLDFERCSFLNNRAYVGVKGYGGGVALQDTESTFVDCDFLDNQAKNGGALATVASTVALKHTLIHGNTAVGASTLNTVVSAGYGNIIAGGLPAVTQLPDLSTGFDTGGALFFADTNVLLTDSQLTENKVEGVNGMGGAISFYGGYVSHEVRNCLITGNSSSKYGGAIACLTHATPKIVNCTFAENTADTLGSAVWTDWSADVTIANSIFQANNNRSIVSAEDDDKNKIVYNLFHNNPDGDYGLYDSVTGQTSQVAGVDLDATNLAGDPLFATGPLGNYYLSQVAAGQSADSPAIDKGTGAAGDQGLDTRTTRTDSVLDSDVVDLGYHYPDIATVPQYTLTASVEGGNGSIAPASGTHYAGAVTYVTATPNKGYAISEWTGTDDDSSNTAAKTVVLWSDRDVSVQFKMPRTITVGESSSHGTIQRAIDEAEDGDVVIVPTGTYDPAFAGGWPATIRIRKGITLSGKYPDDSECVAATVLHNLFIDVRTSGAEATIEGLTLSEGHMMVYYCSPTIRNCVFDECYIAGGDGDDGDTFLPHPPGNDGYFGTTVYGGAIEIVEASPIVNNCTFSGCWALGGNGGLGSNGDSTHSPGYDGGWAGGAYGGAVYCGYASNPTFTECRFVDCYAQGGNGGNGGNGINNAHGGRGGNWEDAEAMETGIGSYDGWWTGTPYWSWWDGWEWGIYDADGEYAMDRVAPYTAGFREYWKYSGYGGAVHCEFESAPKFVNCTFENNRVYGGVSGIGGLSPVPELTRTPNRPINIECFGGALYAAYGSKPELTGCTFTNCTADMEFDPNTVPTGTAIDGIPPVPDDAYLSYGGAIAFEENVKAKIVNCTITDCNATIGGAIYWSDSDVDIVDSNMADNYAYQGGALFSLDSTGTIQDTLMARNFAGYEPNLPPLVDSNDPNATLVYERGTIYGHGGGYYGISSPVEILGSVFRENVASASGGGLYLAGSDVAMSATPLLHNSLVTGNKAGRDGGGVSVYLYAEPTISNCTIADNKVTGALGDEAGFGGGLYVSYGSNARVIDSIIWGNLGVCGAQVAIGCSVTPSATSGLTVSDSDIGPAYDPNQMIDPLLAVSKANLQVETTVAAGGDVLIDSDEINADLDSDGKAAVIVTLHEPDGRDTIDWNNRNAVSQFKAQLANRRAAVIGAFQSGEFTSRYTYDNVASFSGEVTRAGLARLAANPLVRHIEPVRYVKRALRQALSLGNAREIRNTYNGKGIAIAIVDDGIDYTHPRLGGTGVAATSSFPNTKVIGGYDAAENDPDPMPTESHGTACAGIAAGNLGTVEDYIGGVAYGAKLYAVRIFGDDGNSPTDADLRAWDWCITHRNDDPQYPIKVISNSWGVPIAGFADANVADAYSPSMTALADTATSLGITIVAASGNEYRTAEITWPAAMSNVISVGALYDTTSLVTEYSNSAENLDVFAPADPVYTLDMVGPVGYAAGDYYPFFNGTSSACPFVAGCVASIQGAALERIGRYLTPAEVRELLVTTGDAVTDTKVAITKPRVNLGAALTLPSGPTFCIAANCMLNGWLAPATTNYPTWDSTLWGLDANVIVADPCFVSGYYLSQTAAGQAFQSPAVNVGSDSAQAIGLADRTTRIDGVIDANQVDLGYHYADAVPVYDLTVTVLADANDGKIHGTVQPGEGSYLDDTELVLKAIPDAGYFVEGWYDVNDTLLSLRPEFGVVMDSNQVLRVRFRLPQEIVVGGANATGIQGAVNSASNGDTIVISPGVYDGSINLQGKQIRLVSTNPDDSEVVAQTVIDCSGSGRALIFNHGEGPDTVIDGITITNGATLTEPGAAIYIGAGCSPTFINVQINNSSVSLSSGGAVYIGTNSNPTFTNVRIDNCHAYNAILVITDPNDPNGATQQPFGAGNAGAVYIHTQSRPTFTDCAFTNCTALGLGGAIYCGPDGLATFTRCDFAMNDANDRGGAVYHAAKAASKFVQCTFSENASDLLGGAMYYGRNCDVDVNDCAFTENTATTSGGALYLSDACVGFLCRSVLTHNDVNDAGGAVYMSGSSVEITDCNVAYNVAHRGGGLYFYDTPESTLLRTSVKYNEVIGVQRQYFQLIDGTSAPISPTDPNFRMYDPNLVSELVRGGRAVAQGGGVYAYAGPKLIADCQIGYNAAATSGGGLYLTAGQYDLRTVRNCLITDNSAGRDGGGASCSWQAKVRMTNCTIGNNSVKSLLGQALGAGLYVGYDSNVVVADSIVWDNISNDEGSQLAVTGEQSDGSALAVSYSDVEPSLDPNASAVGLDLVFAIDSTDTMVPSMSYVRAALSQVARSLDTEVTDCRMAVVDFRDFNDVDRAGGVATDYPFRVVTPFTEDIDVVVSGISSISALAGAGGADLDESVYYALTQTADSNELTAWRTGNVARVVLLVGDGVPHNPELVVGYQLSDVIEALSLGSSKRVHTLQIGEANDVEAYYRAFASLTDGIAVQAPDANDMTEAITAVVNGIVPLTKAGSSVYVSAGSTLAGWSADAQAWDESVHNIDADPYLLAGYYLSQTDAGQSRQSPAVDAGSGPVDATGGLDTRTTRADGRADGGTVDMGYHYAQGVTLYTVTAQVLPDSSDGLVHGVVTPAVAVVYEGSTDNVIRLEVKGEDGWKVKAWTGTDDDTLTSLVNYVTLTSNRQVTVTLQQRTARIVTVPGDYTTIQGAATAAEDGDTIVVDPGTYYSGYGEIGLTMDKEIVITSRNPDDPATVASTVIRGPGGVGGNASSRLGVVFTSAATRKTVLNGFTIENFGGIASNGDDGDRAGGHPNGEDGVPIHGSAMILLPGASPTIKNCVIRNNYVTAGNGGSGVAATTSQNAGRGGWGGWARGGAIYCASDTNPLFVNCTIANNSAQGGSGGNGGAGVADGGLANYGGNYTPPVMTNIDPERLGATTVTTDLWKIWEWDYATYVQLIFASDEYSLDMTNVPLGGGSYVGDYRWYSGYGGGVFIDTASKAEFVECTIQGNSTVGGMSGQGGAQAPSGRLAEPLIAYEVPSYGGGVYCAADTVVTFRGCNFENNTASTDAGNFRMDPYIGYGGGVAGESTADVLFVDCNFVDNQADTGGAIYLADAAARLIDTRMATNVAIRGAGLAGVGGEVSVAGCEVKNNTAYANAGDVAGDGIVAMGAGIFFSSATADIYDCNIAGNMSQGSGGGIYLRGENSSSINNCLIRGNYATRDGGGVSTNWYATPTISNCTFYANASGDPNSDAGYGGGLFCGYYSNAQVIDCIFWENGARLGTELAVATGFDLDPQCGTLHVSYSDIYAGPNDVFVDAGCTLEYGDGILHKDPRFAAGALGSFYLNPASPCVDVGSSLSGAVGMSQYTTRIDSEPDSGIVDLGYHHPILEPCKFCDLVYDGVITFEDFAAFASKWLSDGCSASDGWCNGADFTFDSAVDAFDLAFFADCWLVQDVTAPLPDPAEWEVTPYMEDKYAAGMVAVEAIDAWGWDVEYYFDCVYGDGHDSGWISSRAYVDSGLPKGAEFGYRVKARDALGNETKWSETRFAGTADTAAPTPEPYIQSLVAPTGVYTSLTMTSTTVYDNSGVQYFFDTNTPGAHASGWIDVPVYTDVNLAPETTYCYRVKARDLSARNNETEWSGWVCVATNTPPELDAPLPNPMQFDPNGMPEEVHGGGGDFDYYAEMTAVTATDASGGIQYYFYCDEHRHEWPDGFSSGWIDTPYYITPGPIGGKNQSLHFKVKARDAYYNETEYSDLMPMILINAIGR